MSEEDKKRVEDVVIVMMTRIKYTPLKIGNQIIDDLYQRIDSRWKYALRMEKEM